jgi:hypothetical protein
MAAALFDKSRHEPLAQIGWDESRARQWIEAIADDADAHFSTERLWAAHPLDLDGEPAGEPFTSLYFGAAGVVWALDALVRTGFAAALRDWRVLMPSLRERNVREVEQMGWGVDSLLMGQGGIALLDYRLTPDAARADAVACCVERNAGHPSNELMWGAPGTLHAALALHEATGERRWAGAFTAGANALAASFEYDERVGCRLWQQQLYGDRVCYIGAAHGFAGNAGTIVRGLRLLDDASTRMWSDAIVETVQRTALRDDTLANWPAFVGPRQMLVQWCHGAPGVIACVAGLADARLDTLLEAAGELVWRAGPLVKGANLCHGTAGNGFAFLKLYRRSGDERWLARARAFAMHAIAQSDRDLTRYGQRRYSLWTGDPGVALYVAACIDRRDELPLLDAEAAMRGAPR